ncbi:hypothetical protein, variant [Phialophora macrospora]|uniref:G domain-containing protein n=1 Tax=Phialophora macrospora TaxID=1851006 RepID=A0A0D2FY05_9EURO|nr:hypothetical protein PV04_01515 [Phialophora macrospora]KIW73389.1 hypothetical protein, variant [Phialophora macrospora]
MLGSFDPGSELTILVIGEPGVGKATFINAFINYLRFGTLDDAMESVHLHWAVSGSFTMQKITRIAGDPEIVHTEIMIGREGRDHDVVEDETSNLNWTTYIVRVGRTKFRLINSTGLCGIDGREQVKQYAGGIMLATLLSVDELNGILFLLKANSTRLTSIMESCLEELFSGLQRDGFKNLVSYLVSPTPGPSISRRATLSTS